MKKFNKFLGGIAVATAIFSFANVSNAQVVSDTWTYIGDATLVDGWILPKLGIDQNLPENQWKVRLEQNDGKQTLYRLVDPYKTGPAAASNTFYSSQDPDESEDTSTGFDDYYHGYIIFDVTDPKHVYFNRIGNMSYGGGYSNAELGLTNCGITNVLGGYSKQIGSIELTIQTLSNYDVPFTTFEDGVVSLGHGKSPLYLAGDEPIYWDAVHLATKESNEPLDWGVDIDQTAKIIFPQTVEYPSFEDILGPYNFKSNLSFTDKATQSLKNLLSDSFEFELTAANPSSNAGTINNFFYEGFSNNVAYEPETGVLTLQAVYKNFPNGVGNTYFAPEGNYTGFNPSVANYIKFQVSPEGELSVKDISVGTVGNMNTGPFYSSADYTNIEITRAEIIEPEVFAGTYEIAGTTFDFTGNELSMDYGELKLVINENNKITSILGYDISDELVNTTYVSAGKVDGNKIVFQTGKSNLPLEYSETPLEGSINNWNSLNYTFVSGPSTAGDEPSNEDLVLTKNEDGTYSLSSFTVWTQVQELVNPGDPQNEDLNTIYTLLYKWEQGEVEYVEPTNFDGAYTISGTYYNYAPVDDDIIAVQANPTPQQGEFVLQINKKNQAVRFADFLMDEYAIKDGENIGIVDGNQLTWEAGFPDGMQYTNWDTYQTYYIGGPSTADFTPGETITFTKVSDEEYSLSPFTVWERKVVNMTPTWTLLQAWNTSVGTGVENIILEKVEPVYYDLQGRKVNNPERGIYIMKVGNSVKKILK